MKTTWCKMTLGRDRGLGLPRVRLGSRGLAMVFPGPAFAATTGAPEPAAVGRTLLQELNLPAIWFLVACSVLIVWLVVDAIGVPLQLSSGLVFSASVYIVFAGLVVYGWVSWFRSAKQQERATVAV